MTFFMMICYDFLYGFDSNFMKLKMALRFPGRLVETYQNVQQYLHIHSKYKS